jgi:hypothetical protein
MKIGFQTSQGFASRGIIQAEPQLPSAAVSAQLNIGLPARVCGYFAGRLKCKQVSEVQREGGEIFPAMLEQNGVAISSQVYAEDRVEAMEAGFMYS